MTSKIGFFMFVGLIAGAILGQVVLGAPAPGAVGLGALGFVLGLLLDYSAQRGTDD